MIKHFLSDYGRVLLTASPCVPKKFFLPPNFALEVIMTFCYDRKGHSVLRAKDC